MKTEIQLARERLKIIDEYLEKLEREEENKKLIDEMERVERLYPGAGYLVAWNHQRTKLRRHE